MLEVVVSPIIDFIILLMDHTRCRTTFALDFLVLANYTGRSTSYFVEAPFLVAPNAKGTFFLGSESIQEAFNDNKPFIHTCTNNK